MKWEGMSNLGYMVLENNLNPLPSIKLKGNSLIITIFTSACLHSSQV